MKWLLKLLRSAEQTRPELDELVWLCITCKSSLMYRVGDILKDKPRCANGHLMELVARSDMLM